METRPGRGLVEVDEDEEERRAERQWRELLLQTLPEALQDGIRKKRNHCVRRVNEVRNRPERG